MRKGLFKPLSIGVTLSVLVYLILRALYVTVCNDEAATYLTYISEGDFIPYYNLRIWSANNHVLNTMLSWLSIEVFGLSDFSLRLPNVLSFIVYAWFSIKLLQHISSTYVRVIGLFLLFGAHYFIEFFAYSRGYGLGNAALLGSIYFTLVYLKHGVYKNMWWALLFMGLAVLANLNLLITSILWLCYLFVSDFHLARLKLRWPFYVTSFFALFLFTNYAFQLKEESALYYGQEEFIGSFWSIISKVFYVHTFTALYFSLVVGSILVGLMVHKTVVNRSLNHPGAMLLALFLGNVFAAFFMHLLIDVIYPSERTILHWYILFVLALIFTEDLFHRRMKNVWIGSLALLALSVVSMSAQHLSLHSSLDYYWAKEQIPESFYEQITRKTDKSLPTISVQNGFYTRWFFFQNHKYPSRVQLFAQPLLENEAITVADFAILDLENVPQKTEWFDTLQYDQHSRMTLVKRRLGVEEIKIDESQAQITATNEEFNNLLSADVSAVRGSSIGITINFAGSAQGDKLQGVLFVAVTDSANNQLYYQQLDLFEGIYMNGERKMNPTILIQELPGNATELNVYFWNTFSQQIEMVKSRVELFEIKTKE
jgi:hypothetical protein